MIRVPRKHDPGPRDAGKGLPEKTDGASRAFLLVLASISLRLAVAFNLGSFLKGPGEYAAQVELLLRQGITVLLPALYYLYLYGSVDAVRREKPSRGEVGLTVLSALVGMLVLTALNRLLNLLRMMGGTPLASIQWSLVGDIQGLFVAMLLSTALMPGISEELLFRGGVMNSLMPYGTRRAVLLSSLLFAMAHGILGSLPVHFLLGLAMGLLYLFTGSLAIPMIYHTLHNALVLVGQLHLYIAPRPLRMFGWYRDSWHLGGATMVTLAVLLLFALLWVLLLRAIRNRAQRRGYQVEKVPAERALRFSRRAKVLLCIDLLLLSILYVLQIAAWLLL